MYWLSFCKGVRFINFSNSFSTWLWNCNFEDFLGPKWLLRVRQRWVIAHPRLHPLDYIQSISCTVVEGIWWWERENTKRFFKSVIYYWLNQLYQINQLVRLTHLMKFWSQTFENLYVHLYLFQVFVWLSTFRLLKSLCLNLTFLINL